MDYNEFSPGDLNRDLVLRDLLDDLVLTSLQCISSMHWADALLARSDTLNCEREYAMKEKQHSRMMLDEVRDCYLSTIGYQ
jgi:hypothetical protein